MVTVPFSVVRTFRVLGKDSQCGKVSSTLAPALRSDGNAVYDGLNLTEIIELGLVGGDFITRVFKLTFRHN